MRKIDWGGAGQISGALGQDRCSSLLPINRYFLLIDGITKDVPERMEKFMRFDR